MTPGDDALPSRFSEQGERNFLCTILFLDLVGFSAQPVDDQARIKQRLTGRISQVLRDIPPDTRLSIDTGDGAALCFLGDPQQTLQAALLLRDLLAQRYGACLPARIGMHTGPVRVVSDINGRINLVGDGLNVAQRIMDFAQPRQILVSRACFDVMSRLGENASRLFRPAGTCQDKHGRLHELFAVIDANRGVRETGDADESPSGPASASLVSALEGALVRYMGPMARLLMEQALSDPSTPAQLVARLTAHIPCAAAREAFRGEAQRILEPSAEGALKEPGAPPRR